MSEKAGAQGTPLSPPRTSRNVPHVKSLPDMVTLEHKHTKEATLLIYCLWQSWVGGVCLGGEIHISDIHC